MAMPQRSYWFRPGRGGHRNPGILSVDDRYEFIAHLASKDKTMWKYSCKYRLTPKVKCSATAKVVSLDDRWILQQVMGEHSCEPSRARVTAELLRHRMKEIVRKDPTQPVGKAVRTVRVQAAELYSNDDDFYSHLITELGTDSALEKQLLRIRTDVIGKTPKSRNEFNPEEFLSGIYKDNDIIILDSNKLDDNWRRLIDKRNNSSEYNWERLNESMTQIERDYHIVDIDSSEDVTEEVDISDRDLPKRVLAFTSKKLLMELSLHQKSSVDGTFKSSCSLFRQQFIWMVKSKGFFDASGLGLAPRQIRN